MLPTSPNTTKLAKTTETSLSSPPNITTNASSTQSASNASITIPCTVPPCRNLEHKYPSGDLPIRRPMRIASNKLSCHTCVKFNADQKRVKEALLLLLANPTSHNSDLINFVDSEFHALANSSKLSVPQNGGHGDNTEPPFRITTNRRLNFSS